MSTTRRLLSGSAASWIRIVVTMASQLLFVPVYLSYWDVSTYGIWLAVQALLTVFSTLDHGHQTYLEFEFMKLASKNRGEMPLVLWSGIAISLVLGFLLIGTIVLFTVFGPLQTLADEASFISKGLLEDAGRVLVMLSLVNLISVSIGGVFVRVLSAVGYYARLNWWGVLAGIVTAVAPVAAVVCGAKLATAGIVLSIATLGYNLLMFVDMARLVKKEGFSYKNFSLATGWKNFLLSLALSVKELLENLRQQGVRIVLAPLSNPAGLTAFSTMRTGANTALQGLNTITNPLLPELMRFLHQRDQPRTEASFGSVWTVVVLFLAPGVVLLQAVVEPVYRLWTKGLIPFNPPLFGFLSLGVLVFAVAQPAMAVIKGNNLLKPQLTISLVSGLIVIGGIIALVPILGITGAGGALLLAEIVATIGYRMVAKKWLAQNGLVWPRQASNIAVASVWMAGATMVAMILWPTEKWVLLLGGTILLVWNMNRYWASLPAIVVNRVKGMTGRLPFVNRLVRV